MKRCSGLQVAAAVAAIVSCGASAQLDSLPQCGISCVNTVIAKGFGCSSQDNACLCKQQDFVFGVRDCASQACGADVALKVNDYVTALCATATQAPPASTLPAQNQPPSSLAAPANYPPAAQPSLQNPPPATSALPSQPPVAETPSLSQSTSSTPAESLSRYLSEVAQATQAPGATTTFSPSTKAMSTTRSTTGVQPSKSSSASDADTGNVPEDSQGLSAPAKIGIGVGAGVGVFAIALALYLLIRRPRNRARSMQISGPLPGSGRDYSGGYSGGIVSITSKNYSELEMRSRRYEDMIPRQSPRRMI